MEADDPGAGGVAQDGEGQASLGGPGSRDGPGDHVGAGRGCRGEAGALPREAPQVAQAQHASLRGAHAQPAPVARIPQPRGRRGLQFSITVPLESHVEAVLAFRYLARCAQPHRKFVEQELIVFDNLLTIKLTSEDPNRLLMSFSSYLHDFCLLIRTMHSVMPPFLLVKPRLEEEDQD